MPKNLLFLALAALPLAGCETTAEVEPPAHTPRLSIAYTLSTQVPSANPQDFFASRMLYVSTSHSITEISRLVGRADAAVELRDASGQVVEQYRPRGQGGYGGTDSVQGYYVAARGYVGQPGQRYTLRASAPGVAAVEAALTLPAPTTVGTGSYAPVPLAPGSSPNPYNGKGRLSFSVLDNAATTDYYLAYARVLDANGQYWGSVYQDYSARNNTGIDIKLSRFDLSEPGSPYQTLPISDAGRNGQAITFSNDITYGYGRPYDPQHPMPPLPAFLEVIVSSLPADTYDFYQSVQRYYDTDGNPFAEPAPLHSNVVGGYGLFGGATDAVLRIRL
ncbi:MAG: DUF4249 family protein [Janthinobacterium lividum]